MLLFTVATMLVINVSRYYYEYSIIYNSKKYNEDISIKFLWYTNRNATIFIFYHQ